MQKISTGKMELISIHAPRTGSDVTNHRFGSPSSTFQSTLPARGATSVSTLPSSSLIISIHAPRTGSDNSEAVQAGKEKISIHAPRTGSDLVFWQGVPRYIAFQSTLPARGATGCKFPSTNCYGYFNPRSPHGERRRHGDLQARQNGISIHAPRTGSDLAQGYQINPATIFQSTLPARGAT